MTAEMLSAADAFRILVRGLAPARADLQQIDSYDWFYDRQTINRQNVFDAPARRPDDAPAYEALEILRTGIREQRIRLRGILHTGLPAEIDPVHAAAGDLDVFAGILTFENADVFRTKTTYTHVHVYAQDLPLATHRPRGARARADWDAVGLALQDEIGRRGFPDDDNSDPRWRRLADAEQWVAEFLQARGEPVGESTIRERTKKALAQTKAGKS